MELSRVEKGRQVMYDMMGEHGNAALNQIAAMDEGFAELLIGFFGDIYGRTGLDKKQKALVTLTTLITQGAHAQLRLHTHTALRAGLTEREIMETVIQCIPYVGFPSATNALHVIRETLDREKN
ncbi:carboxymuconolactone decarboxylase family protein [Paenibacillus cisolokensis]|jgi:Uncharacterized homolog of gamma-carboxymuconolactone decarboxylase subunit|uniref:4-carboxymuconolactone decarboxylase n=1 Tax=Paenibacillus cisolokensis TaxID=1658519 RepID=A0ABQ4N7U3_9BACL|nr:carboxymuconolactone decarboxylase family protein [Paenibacillus cisolokensis]GIQ64242.1 4-carboxymuconolactone decarboxylase [Paenibacillus cisolokensis]